MRPFSVAAMAITTLLVMAGTSADAASFACARAETLVERAICADATLSRLDERLARTYAEAARALGEPRGRPPAAAIGPLREDQRAWIAERDRCGADGACLHRSYERRLSVLGFGSDPDVPGPVDRFVGRWGDGRNARAHILRLGPETALVSLADTEPGQARWTCEFRGVGKVVEGGARLVASADGDAGYTLHTTPRGMDLTPDAEPGTWCGVGGAIASPLRRLLDAEPVRGERPEAERHLVPCEQFPDSEHDCHTIRHVFLNAYGKAMRGDRSGQSLVATLLTVGARIPGKPQSYVVTDPVEGCAWRMVAAGDRSNRHDVNTVRSFCNHLTAPDRAAAEARARSLRQDIAAAAVAIHQAARDAERLPEARRTESRSQQSAAAASWRGERPARPAPAMSQSGADDLAGRQAVTPPVVAVEITGRVVGITDGDTLMVLSDARQPTRVRLAEIDTPEAGQPYGSRARQALYRTA